jgi:hypothetical protein
MQTMRERKLRQAAAVCLIHCSKTYSQGVVRHGIGWQKGKQDMNTELGKKHFDFRFWLVFGGE